MWDLIVLLPDRACSKHMMTPTTCSSDMSILSLIHRIAKDPDHAFRVMLSTGTQTLFTSTSFSPNILNLD